MKKISYEYIMLAVVSVIGILYFIFVYTPENNACKIKGGSLVRAQFGLVCVQNILK